VSELVWARGWLWPLCAGAPVLAALAWLAAGRARSVARLYGAVGSDRVERAGVAALLAGAFALLMALAAIEPLWGKSLVRVERRGLDVIFCLDTSRSMLARDVEPDRLSRAKLDVRSVLPRLVGGDRVGLVAFAGEAKLVIPLTHDLDSFRELLKTVDTDSVRKGGTDLKAALEKALSAADEGHERTTAIVLLTDGEDLGGEGKGAAAECAARGIVVFAVGYGSTKGSKIVLQDEKAGGEAFLKSSGGEEVITSLDAEGLRALCAEAHGDFLRADVVAEPLVEVHDKRLVRLGKRSYDAGEESLHESRFQWLLLPALVLLCASMWYSGGRR
jgi:Ca-activated chloride channel family protein